MSRSSLSSLTDALARAGHSASTATATQTATVAVKAPAVETEPPAEMLVKYAAACVLLGRAVMPPLTVDRLGAILDQCRDGTGEGRARWESGLRRRLDALSTRAAREIAEVANLRESLTHKGVTTWGGLAAEVQRALAEGHAEAWLDRQRAESTQAEGLAIPPRHPGEEWADYESRLAAWVDDIPAGVARRLFPPTYGGDGPADVAGYLCRLQREEREEAARSLEARQQATFERRLSDLLARLTAGEEPASLLPLAQNRTYDANSASYVLTIEQAARLSAAVEQSPQGWDAGLPSQGAPPQGWHALSDDALTWYATQHESWRRTVTIAAGAEARRRWGVGAVLVTAGDERWVVTGESCARAAVDTAAIPGMSTGDVVSLSPSPQGWAEVTADEYRWCGPDVYAALDRVTQRARAPGGLDVRRAVVADFYGRHPEKNYPRFRSGGIMVGIEDALGTVLDDLALLYARCPARIPDGAWRLHAAVRKTAAGGLQMTRGDDQQAVLLVVKRADSGASRRSAPSGDDAPKADSPALCAISVHHWNSFHQCCSATTTLAVVEAGRPLLMRSGVGFRIGGPTDVEEVPGLAEGRPGTPKQA